jgi:hypothetical protein
MKNAMFINMGRLFRKWKSELNTKYMKKGLMPKHMGKITEAQWKEFVQQKTDPKVLTISNEYAEMSKKNIYPHHKGSKGYVAKIPEWKKKIEEAVSAGNPKPLPMSSPPVPKFKEASHPLPPKEKKASTLPTSPIKVCPSRT